MSLCSTVVGLCPFHVIASHLENLKRHFGPLRSDMPLFLNKGLGFAEKECAVQTIEALATRLRICARDTEGKRLFGGHTLRVSCARFLADIGLGETLISLLARWVSPIILRYVREAPLQALHREFATAFTSPHPVASSSSHHAESALHAQMHEIRFLMNQQKEEEGNSKKSWRASGSSSTSVILKEI